MKKTIILLASHTVVLALGFFVGMYTLPILTAPPMLQEEELIEKSKNSTYQGEFIEDLKGSDFLHKGKGIVKIGQDFITFSGSLSPGPDYKLYVVPNFIETADEFQKIKNKSQVVGVINNFNSFAIKVPSEINIDDYNTVVVWCESFNKFISAAKYR